MAVLCWLAEQPIRPKELHLYYAHFREHSPDTFQFVADGIRYARKVFSDVRVTITRHSIVEYFRQSRMIPHPMSSPCSRQLKIEPMITYSSRNLITIDMIGYVKEELKRRANRQIKDMDKLMFDPEKMYPIGSFTNEWCFDIVTKHIGWYPAIYDIRFTEDDYIEGLCSKREIGDRVFDHNNCLPCKNMETKHMKAVKKYFPILHLEAMKLSAELGSYYGRDETEFYTTFGRDLGQDSTCEACKF